jgi:hypothetical protein
MKALVASLFLTLLLVACGSDGPAPTSPETGEVSDLKAPGAPSERDEVTAPVLVEPPPSSPPIDETVDVTELEGLVPGLASVDVAINWSGENWDGDYYDDGIRIYMYFKDFAGNWVWFNTDTDIAVHADFRMYLASGVNVNIGENQRPYYRRVEVLRSASEKRSWTIAYEDFIPQLRSQYSSQVRPSGEYDWLDSVLQLIVTQSDGSKFEARTWQPVLLPKAW